MAKRNGKQAYMDNLGFLADAKGVKSKDTSIFWKEKRICHHYTHITVWDRK